MEIIWKRGWAALEEDRSPRMVDGRKTYDKSGRQRRGTGILTGIGIREDRRRVRDSKRLLVGNGSNILVGLATFSCHLAVASHYVRVRSLQGDRTSCIIPQVRTLEAPCKANDITCANELQNIDGR